MKEKGKKRGRELNIKGKNYIPFPSLLLSFWTVNDSPEFNHRDGLVSRAPLLDYSSFVKKEKKGIKNPMYRITLYFTLNYLQVSSAMQKRRFQYPFYFMLDCRKSPVRKRSKIFVLVLAILQGILKQRTRGMTGAFSLILK